MTTINEALTPLGDGFRKLYGTTDKYSFAEMTALIKNVTVPNLLDENQIFTSTKTVRGLTVDKFNSIAGKTIVLSFDITWEGYRLDYNTQNRIGMEWDAKLNNGKDLWLGAWFKPTKESGTEHVVDINKLPTDEVVALHESTFYVNANVTSVRATNVKAIVLPLGGGHTIIS